tara:strand:- start:387 stop:590 length:204 start_codon:yes stop_codon:yes gene_type:complete
MRLRDGQLSNVSKLIAQLEEDRSWLLKQIDSGRWEELRSDLADLERELGQLLSRSKDRIEEISENSK